MRARRWRLLCGAAACLLAGCGGAAVGRVSTPPTPIGESASAITLRDIAYGPDRLQKLDVYRLSTTRNAPIILMVHGGAWTHGDKSRAEVVQNKEPHWVGHRFVFVSTNYRLVPDVTPMQQVADVARALAYVQTHATEWGGDPRRVVLMGHSAGAGIVSQLTADPRIAKRVGARPWLGTVALDGVANDLPRIMGGPHSWRYDVAFGADPAVWRANSPTLSMDTRPVPMLLVCITRRTDSCPQARELASRARHLGGKIEIAVEDLAHRELNASLGLPSRYTQTVDAFVWALVSSSRHN